MEFHPRDDSWLGIYDVNKLYFSIHSSSPQCTVKIAYISAVTSAEVNLCECINESRSPREQLVSTFSVNEVKLIAHHLDTLWWPTSYRQNSTDDTCGLGSTMV